LYNQIANPEGNGMDLNLKGRRAIVTGGSRGIGLAIVEALAAEGVDVALCARGADGVEAATQLAKSHGVRAFGAAVDLRDSAAVNAWFSGAVQDLGGLDILVSNVSTRPSAGGDALWRDALEADLLQHVRLSEMALPELRKGQGANIVFIASIASVLTQLPPTELAYGAMKAGLINYNGQLAARLGPEGIRVNAVSPGPIEFPGGTWDWISQKQPPLYAAAKRLAALGRLGRPEEVAKTVVFLASPAAGYITGANVRIDGGAVKTSNF
jgi:3-oxoacyl-[acyl-carrier protein] reductase